jgi:hypothetical protein
MEIRKLQPAPILDETQRLAAGHHGEHNSLTPTVIGTMELKAFECSTCGARRSWDWVEVMEQTVVVVCLNCRTHYHISGNLMDALLANTTFFLPSDTEG